MDEKKTTINDIATAAGISKTTVSRYINGRTDLISKETCTRIEMAIKLSGYRPNAIARGLKTQQSFLIGVMVADITSPFSAALVSGISHGLVDDGYVPVFANSENSGEREAAFVNSLLAHQVDGLIVNATTADQPNLISLAASGFPVVLCDRSIADYNFDIALGEYRAPVLDLVRHLHDEGFGRVVLVSQPYEQTSPRRTRHDAFVEGARSVFGVEDPEKDVFLIDPRFPKDIIRAVRTIVETTPEGVTPAVIGVNSVTMVGILNAVEQLGLSMPGDIGICGPDDWGWARQMGWDWSEVMGGGITTFKVDPFDIGEAAAHLMAGRIADPARDKETITIPSSITVRSSTSRKA
ncbi:MAG: LacI family DNA-binding transcriptional regulator [Atopobiaceae bacterium]|nr:LacI family DNA-binding transcriptional regulator [Atopobiaceae bacterium]MDD4381080.1 LacI family DNA-binding transcriptional regulator [Atopobiaceae bacterium]